MEQFVFSPDFGDSMIRFAICALVNWLIVHFLYYSVVLFFLVSMMMSMDRGKATMGVGLGLFGIFSIMRYRTDTIPVREMTYIFIVISLSVVHAMASSLGIDEFGQLVGTPLLELICIDVITIIAVAACEASLKTEASKIVQYDRIELVKPEKKDELSPIWKVVWASRLPTSAWVLSTCCVIWLCCVSTTKDPTAATLRTC